MVYIQDQTAHEQSDLDQNYPQKVSSLRIGKSLHKSYIIILYSIVTILILISFNPFPNKPWFLRVCSISVLKTLWVKEKLLVTSNFSFSRSVFYKFLELSAISIKFEIVVC